MKIKKYSKADETLLFDLLIDEGDDWIFRLRISEKAMDCCQTLVSGIDAYIFRCFKPLQKARNS